MAGFQPVPDVLLIKQRALGLEPVDLLVLLNITSYWWYADKLPFARSATIAERMGVSARTVQRSLKKMETKGLISRTETKTAEGDVVAAIDPSGLVALLGRLAKNDIALNAKLEGRRVPRVSKAEDLF